MMTSPHQGWVGRGREGSVCAVGPRCAPVVCVYLELGLLDTRPSCVRLGGNILTCPFFFNLKKRHPFLICMKVSYGPSRSCPVSQRCSLYAMICVVRPHPLHPCVKFQLFRSCGPAPWVSFDLDSNSYYSSQALNPEAGPRALSLADVCCI